MVSAELDERLVRTLDPRALPEGWDNLETLTVPQRLGNAWYDQSVSVALRVPSVVLRGQSNVLLNPEHPDWADVVQLEAEPFLFDPRLGE